MPVQGSSVQLLQCMLDIPCSMKVYNLDDKDHHWAYLHFHRKHLSIPAHEYVVV